MTPATALGIAATEGPGRPKTLANPMGAEPQGRFRAGYGSPAN